MDVSPAEKVQRDNHEEWDRNGSSLPYSTRSAPALRQDSTPPQANVMLEELGMRKRVLR